MTKIHTTSTETVPHTTDEIRQHIGNLIGAKPRSVSYVSKRKTKRKNYERR